MARVVEAGLDGSLRLETLRELARRAGVEVREDLAFQPGMGLAAALERFRMILEVLQNEAFAVPPLTEATRWKGVSVCRCALDW